MKNFMPCVMCQSPATCEDIGCDRKPNSEAFQRGNKDCATYYTVPGRGHPLKNDYPSNPYNKEGDYERWKEYNRGWNSDAL